ncbi:hypothetical protein CBR_g21054 [Chara braunii]|uniref:Uncharacterized protein n=1 Tax=Chara braunii TaxID=69332 RepID=A0A388L0H4_CHABU|nr:hypothetical protein CBR_g21054 [Chara braunii]|eukprot:GBG75809.1 hypothetical protein CBR_g21054 [Chara braunii]
MTASIDPGEMTVNGRDATLKVNERIDRTKVAWLKEHTVTFIFREGARFLPKKLKDDVVRVYEDEKIQDGSFEAESFRRGRVKMESPNVVSYIAKSTAVATWLIMKGQDKITLGSTRYVLVFKPWLTRVQLREQRRSENEANFWVVAVQVPIDAMLYLEAQVQKAIGTVLVAHPPEPDRLKPSLINLKFDIDPGARQNMKDKISIITYEGDTVTVNLASSDTPRCGRCRAFFHFDEQCRRNQRQPQAGSPNQSRSNQGTQQEARRQYQGPLGPRPSASGGMQGATLIPQLNGIAASHNNPVFSPGGLPGIPLHNLEQWGLPLGMQNSYSALAPWMGHGLTGHLGMPGGTEMLQDAVTNLLSVNSSESPMPTTMATMVRTTIRDKFQFRMIPEILMPRLLVDNPENGKKTKFFIPILDVRLVHGQLQILEQEGWRLLPISWITDKRKQELRKIRVSPRRSAEFLAEMEAKLPKDKKLQSQFLRTYLTSNWLPGTLDRPQGQSSTQEGHSIQQRTEGGSNAET